MQDTRLVTRQDAKVLSSVYLLLQRCNNAVYKLMLATKQDRHGKGYFKCEIMVISFVCYYFLSIQLLRKLPEVVFKLLGMFTLTLHSFSIFAQ